MHFLNNSLNTFVARVLPFVPRALIQQLSQRYIAGETFSQAAQRIQKLNQQGFSVTVDVLGETTTSWQAAQRTLDAYLQVLKGIAQSPLKASISVKPTAFGLLMDPAQCLQLLEQLVSAAAVCKTSVCIDMESVQCTDSEIALFEHLRARHDNVSLALQAYLQRTYEDIEPLIIQKPNRHHGGLRICKGIYQEDAVHLVAGAQRNREAINTHFFHHVARCFENHTYVAIATHDEVLIKQLIALVKQRGVANTAFEFQMLLGVCEPLRDQLLAAGFAVRIYVPFGKDWYGYSLRRIKENPSIAGYVLKAIARR